MGAARFAVIVTAVLLASFFGMKWLLTIQPLRPDARIPSFHHVDPDSAEYKFQQSSVSDDDATRDHLRNEMIDYAKALKDDPGIVFCAPTTSRPLLHMRGPGSASRRALAR